MQFTYDCDSFYSDPGVNVPHIGGDCYVEVSSGAFSLSHEWNASLNVWWGGACLRLMIVIGYGYTWKDIQQLVEDVVGAKMHRVLSLPPLINHLHRDGYSFVLASYDCDNFTTSPTDVRGIICGGRNGISNANGCFYLDCPTWDHHAWRVGACYSFMIVISLYLILLFFPSLILEEAVGIILTLVSSS